MVATYHHHSNRNEQWWPPPPHSTTTATLATTTAIMITINSKGLISISIFVLWLSSKFQRFNKKFNNDGYHHSRHMHHTTIQQQRWPPLNKFFLENNNISFAKQRLDDVYSDDDHSRPPHSRGHGIVYVLLFINHLPSLIGKRSCFSLICCLSYK